MIESQNRILIVDDEPFNLYGLKNILKLAIKRYGYSTLLIDRLVDQASNGKEAVNMVKKLYQDKGQLYGLIITDLSMPVMDGYEEAVQIRNFLYQQILQQPKIIAITGHTEEQYILKAYSHQIDEVISKPLNLENAVLVLKESL